MHVKSFQGKTRVVESCLSFKCCPKITEIRQGFSAPLKWDKQYFCSLQQAVKPLGFQSILVHVQNEFPSGAMAVRVVAYRW